jgi:peptidoglycan hydrolase-like protein with peptidoglycan-binding domain
MNSIWLKIAAVAVVVVVVIIVAGRFGGGKSASAPAEKPATFYDKAERDKKFNEPPKLVEPPAAQPAPESAAAPAPQPPQPQAAQPPQPQAAQVPGRPPGVIYPSDLKGPTILYFKPMSEEDDIQAQELLPYATAGRSIGRLPIMQYGLMMKACEQIEQRWPDSWYAFRAKQMMEEITWYQDRYAKMYKITPQRLDISRFMKPKPGTEARRVEPIPR